MSDLAPPLTMTDTPVKAAPLRISERHVAGALILALCAVLVLIIALPLDIPGVLTRAIYDESFKVVVPRGHSWEGKASIAPEEVAGAAL